MKRPAAEDLVDLRGKDGSAIARWLTTGLREYLFEQAGRKAFPGAEYFIGQQDDISGDLAEIGLALHARNLEAFKDGCTIALRELDFGDDRDMLVAEKLLRIGAAVRATGMLEVLAHKSFRLQADKKSTRIYDVAFEFARDLADVKGPGAVDCLYHLATESRGFRPALSGQALVAMTEVDPAAFQRHYDHLRLLLDKQYGYTDNEREEVRKRITRRQLIARVIARLPYQRLLMYPCLPGGGDRPEVTNWWFDTLRNDFPDVYRQMCELPVESRPHPRRPAAQVSQHPRLASATTPDALRQLAFGNPEAYLPSDRIRSPGRELGIFG